MLMGFKLYSPALQAEFKPAVQGYWTGNKFMKQVQSAVEIAKFKCAQATGLHSFGYLIRCHAASVANDSLNANRISFGVQQPPFLYSALILGNQSSN